ncbi:methylated-DNA--[protein]-cysteine S-methyltransferase [Methanocorpusculum sp. MG]|uniref:Methylated-DNA--protein-cysteine methyltransferase n=1 Tax=Methanocorpusculum petauri TaxID=3002863 RepID=A0ABT4IJB4_9EURY|nr:methylated-DNA--[protein]-cysteine S-methyltransferase [Methanocorpusculum petauri]MCZ0861342.1 methylated-DNA--[protein]-cysteine S-methyltransferase [Methanocorpusculum petauri]MDE2443377.1 methylated-DNA--[protein]-cysteine S-methyltransferase [Methanocorpusculum sp.]
MRYMFYYQTPIGNIGIAEENGAVTNLWFPGFPPPVVADLWETPVLKRAGKQLTGYFAGGRHPFTIPLAPEGTAFMQEVWAQLQKIPYGETRTYQEIAVAIGKKNGARAVGMANNKNPIPILIPCHRVIGRNGKLTGYRGGLAVKEKLLRCEGVLR